MVDIMYTVYILGWQRAFQNEVPGTFQVFQAPLMIYIFTGTKGDMPLYVVGRWGSEEP